VLRGSNMEISLSGRAVVRAQLGAQARPTLNPVVLSEEGAAGTA
jgi:hypothetical protein